MNFQAALTAYKTQEQLFSKLLGTAHPYTIVAHEELAVTLTANGKHDEAEAIFRLALEGSQKLFGPHHSSTQRVRQRLIDTLVAQGKEPTVP